MLAPGPCGMEFYVVARCCGGGGTVAGGHRVGHKRAPGSPCCPHALHKGLPGACQGGMQLCCVCPVPPAPPHCSQAAANVFIGTAPFREVSIACVDVVAPYGVIAASRVCVCVRTSHPLTRLMGPPEFWTRCSWACWILPNVRRECSSRTTHPPRGDGPLHHNSLVPAPSSTPAFLLSSQGPDPLCTSFLHMMY